LSGFTRIFDKSKLLGMRFHPLQAAPTPPTPLAVNYAVYLIQASVFRNFRVMCSLAGTCYSWACFNLSFTVELLLSPIVKSRSVRKSQLCAYLSVTSIPSDSQVRSPWYVWRSELTRQLPTQRFMQCCIFLVLSHCAMLTISFLLAFRIDFSIPHSFCENYMKLVLNLCCPRDPTRLRHGVQRQIDLSYEIMRLCV